MTKHFLFSFLLIPFFSYSQEIISINPNQANPGTTTSLIISGNGMNFSGFSCGNSITDIRFSQYSSDNTIYGAPTSNTQNTLSLNLYIPQNQPQGMYNVEVFDCYSPSWILLPNSFLIGESSSVNTYSNVDNFEVFPNPSNGKFNITLKGKNHDKTKVTIVNNLGEYILTKNISNNTNNIFIDLSTYKKGIYFLKIKTGSNIFTKSIIVQ